MTATLTRSSSSATVKAAASKPFVMPEEEYKPSPVEINFTDCSYEQRVEMYDYAAR
jgi:hypothetical protein